MIASPKLVETLTSLRNPALKSASVVCFQSVEVQAPKLLPLELSTSRYKQFVKPLLSTSSNIIPVDTIERIDLNSILCSLLYIFVIISCLPELSYLLKDDYNAWYAKSQHKTNWSFDKLADITKIGYFEIDLSNHVIFRYHIKVYIFICITFGLEL